MTVKELLQLLHMYDQNLEVLLEIDGMMIKEITDISIKIDKLTNQRVLVIESIE